MSYVEDLGELSKARLLDLIEKYNKSGVILLSGDVHWAQFFSMHCSSYIGYDIPEVCSSGLTHILSENAYKGIEIFMEGHTPSIYKVTIGFNSS